MHVIIARWGSSGDVLPYIAIGSALRTRGCAVTFAGNPYYESRVREAGLAFTAVGSVGDHERLMADTEVFDRRRKTMDEVYGAHYFPHLQDYFGVTTRLLRDHPSAVVIGGEVGSATAAEAGRARYVYVACSPGISRYTQSAHDPTHPERVLPSGVRWFGRTGRRLALLYRLNDLRHGRWPLRGPAAPLRLPIEHPLGRLRAAAGLGPTLSFRPTLVLCLWPDWFASPQPDWPAEAATTGFLFPQSRPPAREAGSAETVAGGAVVVTTGSIAGGQQAFYRTAIDACARLGRPAILVSPHSDQVPAELPANVTYLPFAPFGELFERASFVVHHGGIGTGAYALAAGIPQIAMPMRGDQFDNANRLERLGVARMLPRVSAETLAATIRRMSGSARVADRCRHWQARTDAASALQQAAEAVERLADEEVSVAARALSGPRRD
jgi:rhamnosyltransferase subunit B